MRAHILRPLLCLSDVSAFEPNYLKQIMLMIVRDRQHHATDLTLYVIWQQCISGLCSELVSSIIIFPSTSKRLMSPPNSTRKVNTILKCQEINDIVFSFHRPAEEGDKCLALFTRFPLFVICLSFSSAPFSYLSFFHSSLPLSPPRSPSVTMVFRWQGLIFPNPHKRRCYLQRHSAVHGLCLTSCVVVSKRTALIHLHLDAMRFQHKEFPFRQWQRHLCLCTRPSNCKLLLFNLAAASERRLSCRRYWNPCGGYIRWSYVLRVSLLHILTPPLLQYHPGKGSKF